MINIDHCHCPQIIAFTRISFRKKRTNPVGSYFVRAHIDGIDVLQAFKKVCHFWQQKCAASISSVHVEPKAIFFANRANRSVIINNGHTSWTKAAAEVKWNAAVRFVLKNSILEYLPRYLMILIRLQYTYFHHRNICTLLHATMGIDRGVGDQFAQELGRVYGVVRWRTIGLAVTAELFQFSISGRNNSIEYGIGRRCLCGSSAFAVRLGAQKFWR